MKAVRVTKTGGPEVLRIEDVPVPSAGPGEALVRHTVIGVNFIDTYFRSGLYPTDLPFVPGAEAAGVVEAVGEGVTTVKPGDRVAYAGSTGAYSEMRVMPADRLVSIPDGVDDRTAAAVLLKGLTVQFLLTRTFPVGPEHTVLFHAGAGGVGLIAGQWLKAIGCTSIATVGSDEKAEAAKAAGYTHVINYRTEDFVARVAELTEGAKVDVVYDSVGKDTFPGSLDCLKPRGLFVSFGNSSGPVPPFDMLLLSRKGSLFATRPTLFNYVAKREELTAAAADLFEKVAAGVVRPEIGQTFALDDVVACHEAMAARTTRGATLLLP
ncbi:quinone oxidoreductase family protein [Chthonobacter rhizosphaerae]|uniref:quinone oxidoreductase family protein n=1 Tax=Chthonobacter rhizosphaerae TaxID=2735553 RepID=UPI0015EFB225|nr:quinone oxidoreductase [Chthonobacter rhizosphaerae]